MASRNNNGKNKGFWWRKTDQGYRKNPSTSFHTYFHGKTEGLEWYIYDIVVGNQADMFVKKTKEVAEYTGSKFKNSMDIRTAIETFFDFFIPIPTARNIENTTIDTLMLYKGIDVY